jgi:homogentisate 1,2-dioxygenase
MVTVHPVGLPHGPKPRALQAFLDAKRGEVHHEVAVMADFANPVRISDFALGLSRPNYMDAWSGYTTTDRFAHDPARLADVRAAAERLADARDSLAPE